MGTRVVSAAVIALGLFAPARSDAADRLCGASAENRRTPLIDLINNEHQGIDVGVWFWKDDRYVTALVNAKNPGVPIRIIMDPRANVQYPTHKGELETRGSTPTTRTCRRRSCATIRPRRSTPD